MLTIGSPVEVSALGAPLDIPVQAADPGQKGIRGKIWLAGIAPWDVTEPKTQAFSLRASGSTTLHFHVIPGKGSYAALYPIHAWAEFQEEGSGPLEKAHAVSLVRVSATAAATGRPSSPEGGWTGTHEGQRESEGAHGARVEAALKAAREALTGEAVEWAWRLKSDGEALGAAVVPGPNGLADAVIAFADPQRALVFEGFSVEIDGKPVKPGDVQKVDRHFENAQGTLRHQLATGDRTFSFESRIWAEGGALRVAFSMPGTVRDLRGTPRFSRLMIGTASAKARRVYAGFGNVLQNPGRFELEGGGFTLATRHAGVDFDNGLSLVEATDIFPDSFVVDPDARRYALTVHHDATFSFIPSAHGAFAAARTYRGVAHFQPAAGVSRSMGRMCLDQWDGDYADAARGIEEAARYGVTDALFVKHVWQRWGYDFRLPDIYPPAGKWDDFQAMVAACKRNGILFCPHDNYIDFYPDADGFTYADICFDSAGRPVKAWYNKGRQAQSYRWLPTAFSARLESNLAQEKQGFAPDGCFVDVFSAMAPMDFYDQAGRFHPKTETAQKWGEAFDLIRNTLGGNGPTISEAGHDALIGHLDAGEADHDGWLPPSTPKGPEAGWRMPADDAERVPWHDMASHGSFLLLGGGLGWRYAGGQSDLLHGYGSDDYLCDTVMGGRNPMSEGPFSRRTVMTYWLLHDLCAKLARSEMLSDEFANDDIHRQTVRFSNGGLVRANRSGTDWQVDGMDLPQYGFAARSGDCEVSVARRNGVVSALARSGGFLFADARPTVLDAGQVLPRVLKVEDSGDGNIRLQIEWHVLRPVAAGYQPYLHFVDEKSTAPERIAFQGGIRLDTSLLSKPGTYVSEAEAQLPATHGAPAKFSIRYGLFNPADGGRRLNLVAPLDGGKRARGGEVLVENAAGKSSVTWHPEPPDPELAEIYKKLTTANKTVDFGPVATDGAFRLSLSGSNWSLIPLPLSGSFDVELRLDQLNAAARQVTKITALDIDSHPMGQPVFTQAGRDVRFKTSEGVFAYRIEFQ